MKILKKIGILLLAVQLSSCESFLEVEEVGRASIPVFFTDMDGIRAALPGTYTAVHKYYDDYFMLYPDAAGDLFNMIPTGEGTKMYTQFNYLSTPEEEIGAVGYIWRDGLRAMANANNILEYHPILLKENPGSLEELDRIKGEALFLRALIHFDLVRVYAQPYNFTSTASHPGIPILLYTPGPNENLHRSSVAEVYDQILGDLQTAENILSEYPKRSSYHASHQAVQALLARVNLYMENWPAAKQYADQVIGTSQLTIGEEYVNMFRTVSQSSESIFQLSGHLKGSSIRDFYTPAGPIGYASEKLISLYDNPQDLRLKLLDVEGGTNTTLKYEVPGQTEEERQIDIVVLRAAEMYLIAAEAMAQMNQLSEAEDYLKAIQARALGIDPSEVELSYSSQEELLDIILEERARELSFEGHRLFDLNRLGRDLERGEDVNSSMKTLTHPSPYFILPFPQSELNANNNITQNPEY